MQPSPLTSVSLCYTPFTDPGVGFVYGGDVVDRGPDDLTMTKTLVEFKRLYPSRVVLLIGNREHTKMALQWDLVHLFKPGRSNADKMPPGFVSHATGWQGWIKTPLGKSVASAVDNLAKAYQNDILPDEATKAANPKAMSKAPLFVGKEFTWSG